MNLPNKLTVLRMCMVPVFLFLLCVPLPIPDMWLRIITAAIFVLTSLTDMIDGKIARKYNLITDFGKIMDPLADKFLVIAAMLGLLVRLDGTLKTVFVWAAAIVIFREFAVTSLRMVASSGSGLVIAAAWLGKVKTVTQMLCITVVLLEPVILPFSLFRDYHVLSYVTIAIMSVMTLWSGLDYLKTYAPYISSKK